MKSIWLALIFAVGFSSGALALKFSDIQENKVARAIEIVRMANALNAADPDNIYIRANMPAAEGAGPGANRVKAPEIVLEPGQQAYTTLLGAMRTRLDNAKTAAETYLASVGVTDE